MDQNPLRHATHQYPNAAKFGRAPIKKMCDISAVEYFCSQEKYAKVQQNPLGFGTRQYPKAAKFGWAATKMSEISTVKHLCSRKNGRQFTYAQMPLIMPSFMVLGQTMYKKSVRHFLKPFGILAHQADPWAKVHEPCLWCTPRPPPSSWQISVRSENPSTRWLLPKFVDFVRGVTPPPTHTPCGN